jgi:hypothetical protein
MNRAHVISMDGEHPGEHDDQPLVRLLGDLIKMNNLEKEDPQRRLIHGHSIPRAFFINKALPEVVVIQTGDAISLIDPTSAIITMDAKDKTKRGIQFLHISDDMPRQTGTVAVARRPPVPNAASMKKREPNLQETLCQEDMRDKTRMHIIDEHETPDDAGMHVQDEESAAATLATYDEEFAATATLAIYDEEFTAATLATYDDEIAAATLATYDEEFAAAATLATLATYDGEFATANFATYDEELAAATTPERGSLREHN